MKTWIYFSLIRAQLAAQQKFVDRLVRLMKLIQKDSGNRKKKIDKLRASLSSGGNPAGLEQEHDINFESFDAFPLPLDPEMKVSKNWK